MGTITKPTLSTLVQLIENHSPELSWDHPKADRLGNSATLELAALLTKVSPSYHSILRSISLCNCGLGSEALIALLEALFPAPLKNGLSTHSSPPYDQLRVLKLRGNAIGPRGIKLLAQILSGDSKLAVLDLWDNSLGNTASRPLFEALRVNTSLKSLNLWFNSLNTEVATTLASTVKFNCKLEQLLIGGNDLGDQSCSLVKQALQLNHTLTEIDFTGNTMGKASIESVTAALKHNANRRALCDHSAQSSLPYCVVPPLLDSSTGTPKRSSAEPSDTLVTASGITLSRESRLSTFVILPPALSPSYSGEDSSLYSHSRNSTSSASDDDLQEGDCTPTTIPIFAELVSHSSFVTKISLFKLGIMEIPKHLFLLQNLTKIDLRRNAISELPSTVQQLTQLRTLLISHNRLETLPDSLATLTHLENWALQANPFSLIPRIYIEMSLYVEHPQRSPLWRYLASIRLGGSQEIKLQKAKIMIVGDANVGKTSLLQCMQTDFGNFLTRWSHKLPKPLATDGIDIEAVKLKISKSDTATSKTSLAALASQSLVFNLDQPSSPPTTAQSGHNSSPSGSPTSPGNVSLSSPPSAHTLQPVINYEVWDFAGQDVYYATHSFFLTQNTIYLVVFDLSRNDEAQLNRIDYWIQSIQTRAGTTLSYIILVGTHMDESHPQAGELLATLRRRWVASRDVLEICTVSCKRGTGIEPLKSTLNNIATKFGLAHQVYPKNWLQISDVLKGIMSAQPWISMDKFVDIAKQFYVSPVHVELGVLPALKDLGIVLHFPTDSQLQDTVFINPLFIIKAFADVLTIKHRGFIKSDGILLTKDLHHLWQDDRRHFSDRALVHLFQLFDVAIQLDSERLLVPALLNVDAPSNISSHWPHGLSEDDELRLPPSDRTIFRRNYSFKFLPLGFFAKIIAQCYRSPMWTVKCHWKGGIVTQASDGDLALATFDENTYTLMLRVDGGRYSPMLTHLVLLVDALIKGWYPNALYSAYIPHPIAEEPCFYHIPRDDIMDAIRLSPESRPVITIQTHTSGTPQTVDLFVDLIAPDLALAGMPQITVDELNNHLKILDVIGKGGQGRVLRGEFHGKPVAIKDFNIPILVQEDDFATPHEWSEHLRALSLKSQLTLQHEAQVLANVNHPNIVRLLGFNIHRHLMILEFIRMGHIESYLTSQSNEQDATGTCALASPELQLRIALDVASAMSYLHQLQPAILHRDLAANNIVIESLDVNAPVVAKLIDFGTASFVGKTGLGSYNNEKRYCMSPEALEGRDHSHKSDVYSYAILLWQMWSAQFNHDINKHSIQRGVRPPLDVCSPSWKPLSDRHPSFYLAYLSLIARCWDGNPDKRPEFREVVESLADIALGIGLDPQIINSYIKSLDCSSSGALDANPYGSEGKIAAPFAWTSSIVFAPVESSSTYHGYASSDSQQIEITSIALRGSVLFIGFRDGSSKVHDMESGSTLESPPHPAAIISIIPLSHNKMLLLSGSSISLVEQGIELANATILAGCSMALPPSSDVVIIGTSTGTLHALDARNLEITGSVNLSEVEEVVGIFPLQDFEHEPAGRFLVASRTALHYLSISPELTVSHIPHMPQFNSAITSAVSRDHITWLGCEDGSVTRYVRESLGVPAQAITAHQHRTRILGLSLVISEDGTEQLASISEDVIRWSNPSTLDISDRSIRFPSKTPLSHAIITSSTCILTHFHQEPKVLRWTRAPRHENSL